MTAASSWSLMLKAPTKSPSPSYFPRFLSYQTSNFHNGSSPPLPIYRKVSVLLRSSFPPRAYFCSYPMGDNIVRDLLAELEQEKKRERDDRKRKGLGTEDIDREDEEDYMGVTPLIEKLQKEKWNTEDLMLEEEPTDSDSEDEVDQDEEEKAWEMFETKLERHKELLKNFVEAETLDETFQWMSRIDKYEQKHFPLRPEYRVIGELMNRLKVAQGKEKFILQHKVNRAMRIVNWKEAYNPNNPANYGVILCELDSAPQEQEEQAGDQGEKLPRDEEEDEEESDDEKDKDEILLEKLNIIDKALEEKLARLEHTFGKKGKLLVAEIKHLAEERNDLTEQKRRPLYRKGFDMRLIDMNRTCKVTKGGQVVRYSAIVACGNYNGVIGFAKGKGPAVPIALQKAYEKSFQNLHYVERHEEHTIAHAVQTSYKKTKVYLWPSPTRTGMKAGRVVQNVLHLAGFKNVKSKERTTGKVLATGLNKGDVYCLSTSLPQINVAKLSHSDWHCRYGHPFLDVT